VRAKCPVDLPNPSLRLGRLIVRPAELIYNKEFEEVGVEDLVGLLGRPDVGADDVDSGPRWTGLLLKIIKSPKGKDSVSYSYRELLMQLSTSCYLVYHDPTHYDPRIMASLLNAQE